MEHYVLNELQSPVILLCLYLCVFAFLFLCLLYLRCLWPMLAHGSLALAEMSCSPSIAAGSTNPQVYRFIIYGMVVLKQRV